MSFDKLEIKVKKQVLISLIEAKITELKHEAWKPVFNNHPRNKYIGIFYLKKTIIHSLDFYRRSVNLNRNVFRKETIYELHENRFQVIGRDEGWQRSLEKIWLSWKRKNMNRPLLLGTVQRFPLSLSSRKDFDSHRKIPMVTKLGRVLPTFTALFLSWPLFNKVLTVVFNPWLTTTRSPETALSLPCYGWKVHRLFNFDIVSGIHRLLSVRLSSSAAYNSYSKCASFSTALG